MYKNTKKEDLVNLLGEIEDTQTVGLTVVQLKGKIEDSKIFKDDPEFVIGLLNSIVEERKIREENEIKARDTQLALEAQKVELEKLKLAQLEKELELEKVRSQNTVKDGSRADKDMITGSGNYLENLIKSVKTLTIPVPGRSENFNLFFQTLERAFITKNVPQELKSEILINILGDKATNILFYTNDEELKCYETIKKLVLKEYQPTAYECLMNFRRARRDPKESHVQFASRLSANFQYYCQLREVNDFDALCQLMISDKLFQTLDKETATYINIKTGENWLKPKDLAKEVDLYFVNKGKSLNETTFNTNENIAKSSHSSRESKYIPPHMRSNINKNKYPPKDCYICGKLTHLAKSCPQRNKSVTQNPPLKKETPERKILVIK
ncbi:uncharacterized protein LOC118200645 [Stegodyphus dumicola]|uniref:uncharacterized protein LOC118200645 n=1 Tax=Stegodyphus dumicola TaxID=202533 RepID=UPI0015A84811|nr:uncharacterized protein LOC118200645 [Stegodyphus dumicola]